MTEARQFNKTLKGIIPELEVSSGEEYSATPKEWVELLLSSPAWLYVVIPLFTHVKDHLPDWVGSFYVKKALDKAHKAIGSKTKDAEHDKGKELVDLLSKPFIDKVALVIETDSGATIRYFRSQESQRSLEQDLAIVSAIAGEAEIAARAAGLQEGKQYNLDLDDEGAFLTYQKGDKTIRKPINLPIA